MSQAVPPAAAALQRHERPTKPQGPADDALVAALRQGESWAVEAVHARYTPAMLRIAMRYARSPSLAEDIVQEAWIGVMGSITRFEGRCALKTWIFRILHYRARTWRSKEQLTVSFSALSRVDAAARAADDCLLSGLPVAQGLQSAHPEERALSAEVGSAIRVAIAELPATQRAVVVLRDLAGWPAADVCRHLRLSAGNQRVLLHRARSRLRQALGGYWRQDGVAASG